MNVDSILESLDSNREKLKLLAYFILILALALPLTEVLGQAWRQSNLVRDLFRLRLLIGLDLAALSVAVFGFYLGLLVLIIIDPKKRWQGFLLMVGTFVGLLVLQSMDLFLPNVDFFANFVWLGGGFIIGLLAGGGRKLLEYKSTSIFEFRRAARILYLMLAGFTVISFLELHIVYPDILFVGSNGISVQSVTGGSFSLNDANIVRNIVVSGLFIITIRQFVKYDAEEKFFILGPRNSGKTLFLIGSYLQALDRSQRNGDQTPLNPSQDLMSMIEALDRQETEWIVGATGRGELKNLEFQYVHGQVFPINVQLTGMDYAGEYLERLPDALTGALDDDEIDTTLERLREGVQAADTLMFVVDVERFSNNDPLEINEYFSILQATEDKNVMLIATKADILAEEFQEERGLEPHRYYEEFSDYVQTRLRENEQINALVTEAARPDIHPLYYQTKVDETGNRVPMRDETGSVMTVGYDRLLDKIGRA